MSLEYLPSMGSIDRTGGRPVYVQIADDLRHAIVGGELSAGEPLPAEPELMDSYEASRGTVRHAISVLRAEGLVDIHHGRGMFVRRRPPVRRLAHDRFARRHRELGKAAFIAELEAENRKPEVEVLEVAPSPSPPDIAKRLGLRSNARVLVRRRRYFADGQPIEIATSYLPWSIVKGTSVAQANPGPGGIYARLEEMGYRLKEFTEEVSSRMPLPEEAQLLQLREGIPVIHLVRTAFDEKDQPLEVCDTLMAADSYVLSYRLSAD